MSEQNNLTVYQPAIPGTNPMTLAEGYIIGRRGTYYKRKDVLFSAVVAVPNPLADVRPTIEWRVPRLPWNIFAKVLRYFQEVYKVQRTEVVVHLYYHPRAKRFIVRVTEHDTITGSTATANPNHDLAAFVFLGSIHSHANFGAFHSGTDQQSEARLDGLHIVVGDVNKPGKFSISAVLTANGNRFPVDPIEVIENLWWHGVEIPVGFDRLYLDKRVEVSENSKNEQATFFQSSELAELQRASAAQETEKELEAVELEQETKEDAKAGEIPTEPIPPSQSLVTKTNQTKPVLKPQKDPNAIVRCWQAVCRLADRFWRWADEPIVWEGGRRSHHNNQSKVAIVSGPTIPMIPGTPPPVRPEKKTAIMKDAVSTPKTPPPSVKVDRIYRRNLDGNLIISAEQNEDRGRGWFGREHTIRSSEFDILIPKEVNVAELAPPDDWVEIAAKSHRPRYERGHWYSPIQKTPEPTPAKVTAQTPLPQAVEAISEEVEVATITNDTQIKETNERITDHSTQ